MLAEPIPFPSWLPPGYTPLADEPTFDPQRHLALGQPARVWRMGDFGFTADEIAGSPTAVLVTEPFRILSDEGVAGMRDVLRRLRSQATVATGKRLSVFLRGVTYHSRFIRDLVYCPAMIDHLSAIADTPLLPHTLPNMQGYVNYAPEDLTRAVDTWHVDSTGFAYVMMVNDPAQLRGGSYEYFRGSVGEGARILGVTPDRLHEGFADRLPRDRIASVAFPAAGWAVFQQGHKLLHRAGPLAAPSERITFVPSFVSREVAYRDPTNTGTMRFYGQMGLLAELARHGAWLARSKLDALIRDLPFSEDPKALAEALRAAIADAGRIADELDTTERDRPRAAE
ncbi:MAG: hypothetical protein EXQ94_12950 [Alphaproteobacteria bacterium]|nr:hypothetical protein [Alphaproteobacteria bacterium]